MLAIVVTVNVLLLMGFVCLAFLCGFLLRSGQLKKCRRNILDLERDLLRSDASILEMEKEKVMLLQKMKESKIPVIPMKNTKEEGDKNDQKSLHAK